MPRAASVRARIVAVGNSQGIRIPKPLLEQAGLAGDVELHAEAGRIVIAPTRGSEIRKTRPCLVVSPDELDHQLRTAIVAPMTTATRSLNASAPWRDIEIQTRLVRRIPIH